MAIEVVLPRLNSYNPESITVSKQEASEPAPPENVTVSNQEYSEKASSENVTESKWFWQGQLWISIIDRSTNNRCAGEWDMLSAQNVKI